MKIWALLAVLAVPQDDVDELIRQLGADDLAVREQAMEALIRKGPPVLEKLKSATKDSDPEVALRAQQAIERIERAEAVRKIVPDGRRVTVDLKDVTVDEIARALGVEIRTADALKGRALSLQVRDAELLRAIDALARELRQEWRFDGKAIVFGTDPFVEYPTAYAGPFRFRIKSIRATSENTFNRRTGELEFSIDVDMEEGTAPAGALQILAIEDEGGQKIEWDKEEPVMGRGLSMSSMTINGKTIRVFEENGKLRAVVDDPGSALEGKRVILRNLRKPASKLASLRGEVTFTIPGAFTPVQIDAVEKGTSRSAGDLEATIEEVSDESIVLGIRMKDGSPASRELIDEKSIRIRCGDEEFPATVVDPDTVELGRKNRVVQRKLPQTAGPVRVQILLPKAMAGKKIDRITLSMRQVILHRVPFEFRDVDLR